MQDLAAELAATKARHLAQTRESQAMLLTVMRATANKAEEALDDDPAPDPEAPQPKRPDYILAVTRLSRALHQAMAFEISLFSEASPAPKPRTAAPAAPPGPPDPRRELIRDPLLKTLKARKDPNQAQLLRELDQHLEELLAEDPAAEALDILATLCDHHLIHINPSTLSDEILGIPRPTPESQALKDRLNHPPSNAPPTPPSAPSPPGRGPG